MECTWGYDGGRGGEDFAKNDRTEIKGGYEQVDGGWASWGIRAEMTLAFREAHSVRTLPLDYCRLRNVDNL